MADQEEIRFDSIDMLLIAGFLISTVTLVFALLPGSWQSVLSGLDVRNWSRMTWLVVNVVVVVVLLTIRLAPDLKEAVVARRRSAAEGSRLAERKQRSAEREARRTRRRSNR